MNEMILNLVTSLADKNLKEKEVQTEAVPETRQLVIETINGVQQELTKYTETSKDDTLNNIIDVFKTVSKKSKKKQQAEQAKTENTTIEKNSTYITSYKDVIKYMLENMMQDETKDDITVKGYMESLLTIADYLADKNIIPKYVYIEKEDLDILFKQVESYVKSNLAIVEGYKELSYMYAELESQFDKETVKLITDSVKMYMMTLDSLVNLKDISKLDADERNILSLYTAERNSLFDYLVGRYIIKAQEPFEDLMD